jgi:acyl-CoA thioesterase-1
MRSSLLIVLLGAAALAQEPGGAVAADPLREITDQPGLPRLLIIGDSISMGYTEPLRKMLAGKFNVHHIPENGGPTINGVAHIDKWLGNGHWDIIVFNFGLHDLKLDEKGGHQVELPQYEANLRIIAEGLRKTGAKLVWVTTTPVPAGKLNPPRRSDDVAKYNQAAERALAGTPHDVCDLYSAALPQLVEIQQKENVHFTPHGYELLAQSVKSSLPVYAARGCSNCINQ